MHSLHAWVHSAGNSMHHSPLKTHLEIQPLVRVDLRLQTWPLNPVELYQRFLEVRVWYLVLGYSSFSLSLPLLANQLRVCFYTWQIGSARSVVVRTSTPQSCR